MRYCSQCDLVHGEEHRFCQRCGQLLRRLPPGQLQDCPRCGAPTVPGQKFCLECGLPLKLMAAGREEVVTSPPPYYSRPESRSRTRRRRPGLWWGAAVVLLVLVVYGGYRLVSRLPAPPRPPVATTPQEDLRREVERVAERIRAAHLAKDINKWLTCYAPTYPDLGRLESQILELWRHYDIKDVSYRISDLERKGERQATGVIVWNIQLYDQRTHDYSLLRPAYRVTLERYPDGWKILDSREEGS